LKRPIRIAIAGAHSTGKSSFLDEVEHPLKGAGLKVGRVADLARQARARGFPILRDHTIDSTLWIITEGLRQEAEAALAADVLLIDRPPIDALGYYDAAISSTGRLADEDGRSALLTLARWHLRQCDIVYLTELNPDIPLGPGRDTDSTFRQEAARAISELMDTASIPIRPLTSSNREAELEWVIAALR
tara:strand:+ start:551 stop:1117 length:567 start_codon:yes stop_codon:yes gene_type:complete